MFKGFYNLTSGMLSQNRRLDVVSNNMTNVSTAGYKADRYTDSTFQEFVMSRVGNKDKTSPQELGPSSYILAPSRIFTDYSQGAPEVTGLPLDFAISGQGFFAIQSNAGTGYTRAGSFSLDNEGYLCLPDEGRVLDTAGNPIQLGTDRIQADAQGNIYQEESGEFLGKLGVYTFADYEALERNPRGLFEGGAAQPTDDAAIQWKAVERSNVDLVQQMVEMLASQRSLQSAAQLTKMYDQIMGKAANDLGSV
ncbi:MAG: flhO [Firmicutes bacterium]|nr:flhO [Bacillota bacterium]